MKATTTTTMHKYDNSINGAIARLAELKDSLQYVREKIKKDKSDREFIKLLKRKIKKAELEINN